MPVNLIADSSVNAQTVAAFIGPLLVGMGLLGGFAGWIINRASKAMQAQIDHVMTITTERIANITAQLVVQGAALETQGKQLFEVAVTVARLEGALTKESKKDG